MRPFILSTLLVCLATYISAFPTGAPNCVSNPAKMAAVGAMGKQTELGFKVEADIPKTGYTPGKAVKVTITGGKFKGILMYASDAKGKHVGELDLPAKGLQYKAGCDDPKSTVTHSDATDKEVAVFNWTPPAKSAGTVMFNATFVRSAQDGFQLVQSIPYVAAGDGKTPPVNNATTTTPSMTMTGTMTMSPGYGAPTGTDMPTGTGTDMPTGAGAYPTGTGTGTGTGTDMPTSAGTSPTTTAAAKSTSGGMSISQYSSFGALVIANVAAIAILI